MKVAYQYLCASVFWFEVISGSQYSMYNNIKKNHLIFFFFKNPTLPYMISALVSLSGFFFTYVVNNFSQHITSVCHTEFCAQFYWAQRQCDMTSSKHSSCCQLAVKGIKSYLQCAERAKTFDKSNSDLLAKAIHMKP